MNVLKVFTSGLAANLVFVGTGLAKQYFVATSLQVADFGAYGSLVALASLVIVLVPFPNYLNILIHGFSAAPGAFGTRKRLVVAARQEMMWITAVCLALAAAGVVHAVLQPESNLRVLSLLLLLSAQYATTCTDLLLRMQQAHGRLAAFMVLRNLPAVVLLAMLHIDSPAQVALVEFVSAALMVAYFSRSPELKVRHWLWRRHARWQLGREQITLWLARLLQFGNASLLRLLVPLLFAAHDTGLFFFAFIAQLPCSLFLSVTTQMFGHTLARIQRGDWRTLWRTQAWFAVPNLAYVVLAVLLVPMLWSTVIGSIAPLAKYAQAGPLVVAAVVYSAVLASDCQEYLLRARGLSRVLLWYSAASIILQAAAVGLCSRLALPLAETILVCAALQALVLAGFSAYSFQLVVAHPSSEKPS